MGTHAVIAHYWIDYRERSEAFETIPAAFEFLREQAVVRGFVVNKVALECGTVVLSRGDIAQLMGTGATIHASHHRKSRPAGAISKLEAATGFETRFGRSILNWAVSKRGLPA